MSKRTHKPEIFTTPESIRAFSRGSKAAGDKVALVPTMGALHEGHLSLVKLAKEKADKIIVSIFVNPAQFGPNEDYQSYPRKLEEDISLLEKEEVAAVFTPEAKDMYPSGHATNIHVGGVSEGLCGAKRPGHFDGVTTIVAKLLIQCEPDIAIFGKKDYQQLCVIKRLVKDLNIPCEILGGKVIREESGLALSSRNAYLSPQELATARQLYKILNHTALAIQKRDSLDQALEKGKAELRAAGFDKVDYLELRDAANLTPLSELPEDKPARLLVAAYLGPARLIDNISLPLSK